MLVSESIQTLLSSVVCSTHDRLPWQIVQQADGAQDPWHYDRLVLEPPVVLGTKLVADLEKWQLGFQHQWSPAPHDQQPSSILALYLYSPVHA